MLENRIENFLNSSDTFGKVNIILYIQTPQINLQIIYNDIIRQFKPDEIKCSLFNLDTMEMMNIDIPLFLIQKNTNSILRVVFVNKKEEIILEYYKEQFIIEHLFRPYNIQVVNGYSLIGKYRKENAGSLLVIGYELSININSYESSLMDIIADNSLYPIFMVKNNNDSYSIEEYGSDNSEMSQQKSQIIREYLKLIDVNLSSR